MINEAKQELEKVIGLAVELSDQRIKTVETHYYGDTNMFIVLYRTGNADKLQYHEMVWLDNEESWPKLRKIRHDLEQLLPGEQRSQKAA